MLQRASLSNVKIPSEFSTSWFIDRMELQGSTIVSDTFGDGNTVQFTSILFANYSLVFSSTSEPSPLPVPPPILYVNCIPYKQSQFSASLLTQSITSSTISLLLEQQPLAKLLPVPQFPEIKLFGLNRGPMFDDWMASKAEGSKSIRIERGIYRISLIDEKYTLSL